MASPLDELNDATKAALGAKGTQTTQEGAPKAQAHQKVAVQTQLPQRSRRPYLRWSWNSSRLSLRSKRLELAFQQGQPCRHGGRAPRRVLS